MNSIEFKIKSFAELTQEEIKKLQKVGKNDGAFFEILSSLKSGAIKEPEKLFLSIGYDTMYESHQPIVGWALLDLAKEYNEESQYPTIMAFVKRKYRSKGFASKLIESLNEKIPNVICAYVSKGHKEREFFQKVSKKINKEILLEIPKCYFAKWKTGEE